MTPKNIKIIFIFSFFLITPCAIIGCRIAQPYVPDEIEHILFGMNCTLSPTNKIIACTDSYTSQANPKPAETKIIDLHSGKVFSLETRKDAYDAIVRDWSPDGKKLLLFTDRNLNLNAFVTDIETSGITQLATQFAEDDEKIKKGFWSNDGEFIYFLVWDKNENSKLYQFSTKDNETKLLLTIKELFSTEDIGANPQLSQTGNHIFYIKSDIRFDIIRHHLMVLHKENSGQWERNGEELLVTQCAAILSGWVPNSNRIYHLCHGQLTVIDILSKESEQLNLYELSSDISDFCCDNLLFLNEKQIVFSVIGDDNQTTMFQYNMDSKDLVEIANIPFEADKLLYLLIDDTYLFEPFHMYHINREIRNLSFEELQIMKLNTHTNKLIDLKLVFP